ncbi:MAG: LysR family transcriptional regulator [Burkholderiales bacterium GWA2_64_37]|nr:MAG: LysR family transcriptional regulator [Burkholderiales bacterium GWA2_64_37]
MTFKQLEAIYWVAQLGGFSQAANKLHTTQSAVSKRVQELEVLFSTPLFDRSLRTARLTEKGEEMFVLAKQMLAQRDAAVEQFVSPTVIERRLKIGVTELTALTWLPRLVSMIQTCYPKVIIEPDVDMSAALRDKLLADEVDIMIVPSVLEDPRFTAKSVGKVENAWMCKPGLLDARRPLRMHELAAHRLLIQGQQSGTGIAYGHWLKTLGVQPTNTIVCNSLLAMIGMAVSGLGVSYLPRHCLAPLLDRGALEVVNTTPVLPETSYAAMYKSEQRSTLISSIVMLAQESCDFTHTYQIE